MKTMFRRRLLVGVLALMADSLAAASSPPEVLRIGHWLEIRGVLDGDGVLVAQKAELTRPDKHETLVGTVAPGDDAEGFSVLGQRVKVSEKTEWHGGLVPGDLAGRRLKVEGHYRDLGTFSAREIAPRDAGRARIHGRLDSIIAYVSNRPAPAPSGGVCGVPRYSHGTG